MPERRPARGCFHNFFLSFSPGIVLVWGANVGGGRLSAEQRGVVSVCGVDCLLHNIYYVKLGVVDYAPSGNGIDAGTSIFR